MNISNKTILITGGGSGIGLETAKLLSAKGNKVIILGRNADKLEKAAAGFDNIIPYQADINNAEDVKKLAAKISADFSDLSVLINNAASAYAYNIVEDADAFDKASDEILTNYLSVIRLNGKLIPILKNQQEAAIVNVTSIAAITPHGLVPSYSDTKAALHSNTLTLRRELAKDTVIRVFELMPPLVNTEFSKEIGGERGMPAIEVAQSLIDGIENDTDEIYAGMTKDFRELFFSNSKEALKVLNAD